MDNHLDETTAFEVTVTSDGVSTSGISGSPRIVLDTNNTLSWGINECSSSFQSVSSCETLESYEHNVLSTESPQVIIVPFLADNVNEITETLVASNGVHIPMMKECSIRIDPLKMSSEHCDGMNVEKIIELPFSTNCATDCSTKAQPSYLTDDDSCGFEGFAVESTLGTEYELYRNAVSLIQKNAARAENERRSSEATLTERILTERHLTERTQPERPPPERNMKPDMVKRPRQIQRKVAKPQLSDKKVEAKTSQSRIQNTEINLPTSTENSTVKPVPIPARVSPTPAENVDIRNKQQDSSSDSSDSDNNVTPKAAVDNTATKKTLDRSAEIKNKQKELKKLEKMRRKKNLSMIAERIREHWTEFFASAKRKQRKADRKNKMANKKYKSYHTKDDSQYRHRGQRKSKKVSCSSDSDSDSTGSSTSKTSGSSSSSDSDSNDSDDSTRASDTSYTSHTRTESDSTDSDSSDTHHSYSHRFNRSTRSARSSSDSTDTSETTSSDDTFDKERRKYHLLKKANYRKQYRSNCKSDENCPRLRKRRASESYRPGESLQKKKRMAKELHRGHNGSKRPKNRTIFGQKQPNLDVPSRSPSAKVRRIKSEFVKRSRIESTSAGDFAVKQCCFD